MVLTSRRLGAGRGPAATSAAAGSPRPDIHRSFLLRPLVVVCG